MAFGAMIRTPMQGGQMGAQPRAVGTANTGGSLQFTGSVPNYQNPNLGMGYLNPSTYISSMTDAANAANTANAGMMNATLGGFSNLGSLASGWGETAQGNVAGMKNQFGQEYEGMQNTLAGFGTQQKQDILNSYQAQQAGINTRLGEQGLGGTTVGASMAAGLAGQQSASLGRLNQQILEENLGLEKYGAGMNMNLGEYGQGQANLYNQMVAGMGEQGLNAMQKFNFPGPSMASAIQGGMGVGQYQMQNQAFQNQQGQQGGNGNASGWQSGVSGDTLGQSPNFPAGFGGNDDFSTGYGRVPQNAAGQVSNAPSIAQQDWNFYGAIPNTAGGNLNAATGSYTGEAFGTGGQPNDTGAEDMALQRGLRGQGAASSRNLMSPTRGRYRYAA
jgi:hypothetical protein